MELFFEKLNFINRCKNKIGKKNKQSIKPNSFTGNRFNGSWSSKRQPARVGVKQSSRKIKKILSSQIRFQINIKEWAKLDPHTNFRSISYSRTFKKIEKVRNGENKRQRSRAGYFLNSHFVRYGLFRFCKVQDKSLFFGSK